MIAAKKITDPWHHSQSWSSNGHQWRFTYNSFNATYIIENSDRTIILSVPIRETAHYPSPQAWLDHWAKTKGKRQLDQGTKQLEQPSLLDFQPQKSSVTVEVVESDDNQALTETDELTHEEERDLLHLERKVERAFYEAGKALKEIRDRKLYRSTHQTFEQYCADRFAFKRRHPYQLMNAAQVVDNLLNPDFSDLCANRAQNNDDDQMCTNRAQIDEINNLSTNRAQIDDDQMRTNRAQNETDPMCANRAQIDDEKMCANRTQILPTSEWQVRPLTKLEPTEQVQAWTQAVEQAGGKVPSHRIVKSIVDQIRERTPVPNPWRKGEVAMIMVKDNPDLRGKGGCWCVITVVHDFSCTVRLWDGNYQVKPDNLKELPYSNEQQEMVRKLCDRLTKLYDPEMEETAKAVLASLGKIDRPYLTEFEERLLIFLEENN